MRHLVQFKAATRHLVYAQLTLVWRQRQRRTARCAGPCAAAQLLQRRRRCCGARRQGKLLTLALPLPLLLPPLLLIHLMLLLLRLPLLLLMMIHLLLLVACWLGQPWCQHHLWPPRLLISGGLVVVMRRMGND